MYSIVYSTKGGQVFGGKVNVKEGQLRLSRQDGASTTFIDSGVIINDNQFHHLVYKKNGTQLHLNIDGKHVAQTIDTTSNNIDYTVLRLGRNSAITDSLLGNLDEFASWSRALSDTEILKLYRRGANRIKFQVRSCVDSSCICKSFNVAPAGSETDCDGDGILNAVDTDDVHKSEFIGPGGDGTTYYSELYNRSEANITFQCALNTTDSHPGICVSDEITLTGGSKPTGPNFLNTNYTQFVHPPANQYAQYRVYMEADENTACGGGPCLPELSSVNLNPSGAVKHYGGTQIVKPIKPLSYTRINSAEVTADACVTFQLSPDGNDANYYYWDGSAWTLATDNDLHLSTSSDIVDHITAYVTQMGPGQLHLKAYLKTSADQTAPCEVSDIDFFYSEKN